MAAAPSACTVPSDDRPQEARAGSTGPPRSSRPLRPPVGRGRRERLGHRRVGPAVHQPERLADPVADGEPRRARSSAPASSSSKPRTSSRVPATRVRATGCSVTRGRLSFRRRWPPSTSFPRSSGRSSSSSSSAAELRRARRHARPRPSPRARAGARRAHGPVPVSADASTTTGAASSPTTCSASRPARRPPPRAATCAAPRPRAPGRGRCSTRSTSSTARRPMPDDPRGRRRPARARRRAGRERPERPAPAARASSAGRRRPSRRRLAHRRWLAACCSRCRARLAGRRAHRRRRRRRRRPTRRAAAARRAGPGAGPPRGAPRWRSWPGQAAPARAGPGHRAAAQHQQSQAYEVWLYNTKDDARSLGAQVTERRTARCQGAGRRCPRLREVPLHRHLARADRGPEGHSGDSVLRGSVRRLAEPSATNKAPASGRSCSAAPHARQLRRSAQPGSSLPGFMIPAGSSRSFAARSSSTPELPHLGRHPRARGRARRRGGG